MAGFVPLGRYWRMRPLAVSFDGRCHGCADHRNRPSSSTGWQLGVACHLLAGQTNGQVAGGLGLAEQTVGNWVKADDARRLRAAVGKPVIADQQEISRLKADLARARMEFDILKKAAAYFAKESL